MPFSLTTSEPKFDNTFNSIKVGGFAYIRDSSAGHRNGDLVYRASEDIAINLNVAPCIWTKNMHTANWAWKCELVKDGTELHLKVCA